MLVVEDLKNDSIDVNEAPEVESKEVVTNAKSSQPSIGVEKEVSKDKGKG